MARALPVLVLSLGLLSCADVDENFDGESELESDELGSSEQALTGGPFSGAYHWDAPRGPALVDAAGAWRGRAFSVAMAYAPNSTWAALRDLGWQLPTWGKWVKAAPGRRFAYSLPMLPYNENATLAACAQGAYDANWKALGGALVDAGLANAIVRPGWEFDGDWFKWSARGREKEYAGCFRRVVTAMRSARTNQAFLFEWSSSDDIFMATATQVNDAYPGDAYVDLIGVNAYDVSWVPNSYPLPANCNAQCASSRRLTAWNDLVRGMNFMRDLAVKKNKSLSIPEWGLWHRDDGHGGGDNAEYIYRMNAFIKNPANRVFYESYFDVDYVDGGHQISDVSGNGNSAAAGHAYKTRFPLGAAMYRQLFSK